MYSEIVSSILEDKGLFFRYNGFNDKGFTRTKTYSQSFFRSTFCEVNCAFFVEGVYLRS